MARWTLQSIYDYFGAHNAAERFEHEVDRARQRVVFPFALLPFGIFVGRSLGLTDKGYFGTFVLIPMCYGLLSLAFLMYLRKRPTGGVGIQYLFLLCDPIVTLAAIAYEPHAFSWLAVLLLVVVTRTGVRYGMRALMLSWGSAIIGAMVLMVLTVDHEAWVTSKDTYLVVASTLFLGVPLFIPVIRIQSKARELDLERVKVQAMSDHLTARSQFLSRVSHELRSPLQAILSALDVMSMRQGKPLEPALMRRMERAAGGLNAQLNDLLTLARGEAGSLKLVPVKLDWSRLFEDVTEGLREAAEAKGLELELVAPEEADLVVVDGLRVCQIAENLLSNAVKYTEFGSIAISIEKFDEARGLLKFHVRDTGAGIAPEDVESIFAPYERAGAKGYGKESAGVGLSVVKTLLTYLGGTIEVRSKVGKGSTFTVTIPAVRPDGETGAGKRVLIIDDREDVLVSLAGVVVELGYETDTASSAGEASNRLSQRAYDVVFFDLQMPLKTGGELASDIRRTPGPNQNTRFIAMTASEDEMTGRGWPFDAFARKPLSVATLKRLLSDQSPAQVTT